MTERVLPYERGIVPQDTSYWCGPASAQTVLNSRGIRVDEALLAREIGTTSNGTDYVGLIEKRCLDKRLPDANYTSVYLADDPPTQTQKVALWDHLTRSINGGFGVVMNWVAPPGNKPRGIKGSPNPSYSGGTTYHYVAAMGYDDNPAERAVWIADSGFRPYGYWISFEQCATLIPDKGYCYADVKSVSPAPAPTPPPIAVPNPTGKLTDPRTKTILTSNRYHPRGLGPPKWAVVHTREGSGNAVDFANWIKGTENSSNPVSYHRVVDDKDIVVCVENADAPWSASNANRYAFHICFASSYAGWSRDKWLDPNVGPDGINEAKQLALGARQVAQWCQDNGFPPVWIGGRAKPPWGLDGVLGHIDLGTWGGGHTDPGANFPVNEFMRQVTEFYGGAKLPPLVRLPPVALQGTDPGAYADWMIYRGNPNNDPARVRAVQNRLKRGYRAYAGHLVVNGDYSSSDDMAVREFQLRSGIVVDGIVGPYTAAALKVKS